MFALSGMVRRTGLVEVPMGTTIRSVVFDVGGGIPNGKKCKAVQIGGPSGGCIPEPHLDLTCDYEALKNFGAIMGSGGLVVLDENTCMVDLAKFFMEFIQTESCGKCIPCREGTRRMLEILKSITQNRKREEEHRRAPAHAGRHAAPGAGRDHPPQLAVRPRPDRAEPGALHPEVVPRRVRGAHLRAALPGRRLPGTGRRPLPDRLPGGHRGVALRGAHRPRRVRGRLPRHPRRRIPFPSVCARVCNHPCESVCRCGTTGGEPIAIRHAQALRGGPRRPVRLQVRRPDRGPTPRASRSSAPGPPGSRPPTSLSLLGYKVTIFEKEARAGGMLVAAIPEYRLPRADAAEGDRRAAEREHRGQVQPGARPRLHRRQPARRTATRRVYVAIGVAHAARSWACPARTSRASSPASSSSRPTTCTARRLAKGRVGIIGGGNRALDAARVAHPPEERRDA